MNRLALLLLLGLVGRAHAIFGLSDTFGTTHSTGLAFDLDGFVTDIGDLAPDPCANLVVIRHLIHHPLKRS